MNNLYSLPSINTREERIQARINAFRKEFLQGDGDLEQAEQLLELIIEYLSEFEDDPMLAQAYIKLNEGFFWLSSFSSDI